MSKIYPDWLAVISATGTGLASCMISGLTVVLDIVSDFNTLVEAVVVVVVVVVVVATVVVVVVATVVVVVVVVVTMVDIEGVVLTEIFIASIHSSNES